MQFVSPNFVIKLLQHRHAVLNILLRLLPHVEDRAVLARTQDILV